MDYTLKITYTKVDSLGQITTKTNYFVSPANSKEEAITSAQSTIDNFINAVTGSLISIN